MSGKTLKEKTINLSLQHGSYEHLQKYSLMREEKYE
jgi:hypothetical protein